MAMLKAIGAEQLEINFGAGKKDANAMRGRVPVWPTNIIAKINDAGDDWSATSRVLRRALQGVNVVMASTDTTSSARRSSSAFSARRARTSMIWISPSPRRK